MCNDLIYNCKLKKSLGNLTFYSWNLCLVVYECIFSQRYFRGKFFFVRRQCHSEWSTYKSPPHSCGCRGPARYIRFFDVIPELYCVSPRRRRRFAKKHCHATQHVIFQVGTFSFSPTLFKMMFLQLIISQLRFQ